MDRFPSYRLLSWILAILVHGNLLVILALVVRKEEVACSLPKDPSFECALVQPRPLIQVDLRRDAQFGRWPMKCDHRNRTLEIAEDRLGDGLRCEKCGWPWWVLRGWPQD